MSDGIWLCDDQGNKRERFVLGRTVFVAGRGLRPLELYEFELTDASGGKRNLLAQCITDRHGGLPMSTLLPRVGLEDAPGRERRTLAQVLAAKSATSAMIRVTPRAGRGAERRLRLAIAPADHEPAVFACDPEGRLQSGVEAGRRMVAVALFQFPAGCVRIFTVRRQFGWRIGDPIQPIVVTGRPLVRTIEHDGVHLRIVEIASSEAIAAGSYQFVCRAYPPGWYEADTQVLLPKDVLSDRLFGSLVVRWPFRRRFGFDNGIVLTPEIAGRPLAHAPYFRFQNTFPKRTDVYAALDPDALPQGLVSKRAAIYAIRHKTAAERATSNTLDDISGPGMTAAPKIVPIVSGCINWNTTLVWPSPKETGRYDIAIDFGNNATDPSAFAPDGHLDPPLDMIDGYVRVGFTVTDNPGLPGPYAGTIGQHDYAAGTIMVPSTGSGPTPTDALPLSATIRYPAEISGNDAPFAAGQFPLVVMMHGNSGYNTSYLGYNYLLDHLASHGFVAMSIYAPVGVMIETRARAILAHIAIMAQNNLQSGLFQGHLDLAHIGIAGHSRGGEAVVRAARINSTEALGWSLQAGVSIAPTDYFHYGDPGIPLLVIYGANDGDVAGTWPDRTCFDIYDESGRPRSFVFVYGATHDQFNTVWAPTFLSVESDIAPGDIPNRISLADHENVAKAYVTAYMQAHLQGRDEQSEYFSTNLRPSLLSGLRIHVSHQEPGGEMLDNFAEMPPDPTANTLGGAVTGTALSTLQQNELHTLDVHSPHVASGAQISWQSETGAYTSALPPGKRDLSSYSVMAFRVTQTYGSLLNPIDQAQDLFVRLTDGAGHSRAIRASMFTDIPYPYVRGYADLIKSAMKSVRIPLAAFGIANLGAQDVDLTDVRTITFAFATNPTGLIEIDDIEFTTESGMGSLALIHPALGHCFIA